MNPERRQRQRERPRGLSYIQFEPEGGGIVLNASEQGLAFHAAAVRRPGAIRLCVSPNPLQRIEVMAEIVWMDETKKSGGLRFTELTAETRNQIHQWLTQANESETPDRKFAVPSCVLGEEAGPCSHAQDETQEPLPPAPSVHQVMPALADSTSISVPRYCVPTTRFLADPFSQEKQIAVSRPQLQRVFATGFLILVFVFMPILFLQNFRREIGSALIRMGEKLRGDSASQTNAALSMPVQISNPGTESTASSPHPIPETPENETLGSSGPAAASTQTTEGTANSKDSWGEDLQFTRQSFAGANTRRGRSGVARQLWSAVQAGDSSAEVALAELYLKGDGVPRSCEQARVLLRAASKSGNIEAAQQLRRLNKNTCR